MRISTRGEYGIKALLELSQRHGEGYTQSFKIASARSIPEPYLYQLLIALRKAGLVRSRRGPQGGHMLARPPDEITLAQAVLALEGPLEPISCLQDLMDDCPFSANCPVRDVWQRITDATREILDDTNFGDLARAEQDND